jgi:heme/copper-type cytochrome/quinol oxidase subunit 2
MVRPIWIILAVIAVTILVAPIPRLGGQPIDRHYRVEAARFEYSPGVLRANPGDQVTIELVSNDVVHGLEIDGYGVGVTADPGQPAKLTFVADQSGSFRMRCSVTCGGMHPFMIGKLQVGQNQWLVRGAGLALLAVVAGVWKIWK